MDWFVATLRQYPEIALFLSLGIGYWVGGKSFKGFSLGAVTATLLAAIAIGQLGIKVSPDVKATFFLIFLFAIGYGVGPQFVRGITKDGVPQAIFAVDRLRVLPRRQRHRREGRRLRSRRRGRPLCRIANDFGIDGPRNRRHQPVRARRRIRRRRCSTSCRRRTR